MESKTYPLQDGETVPFGSNQLVLVGLNKHGEPLVNGCAIRTIIKDVSTLLSSSDNTLFSVTSLGVGPNVLVLVGRVSPAEHGHSSSRIDLNADVASS